MSTHREEHIELCAGQALGSLDPADQRELDAHLAAGCAECEAALRDFSAATVALAASSPAATPSPALRARVMDAIAAEGAAGDGRARVIPLEPRRASRWATWTFAAAAAAFAVTSAVLWKDAGELRTALDERQRQIADLSTRLTEERELNQVLSAPGARVAVLEMTPAGEQALKARATYDPATRSAVLVFDNFTPPAGKDYELWAIRGAAPASLGVIQVDESGHAVVKLSDVGDPSTLNAFAVSLENKGGSGNPTAPGGPVVMLGKLSG